MLRIAPSSRSGDTREDIKVDFSVEQLAGIGAVAMAWNEIEFMLDVAIYSGEALPASCLQDDLPRRRLDEKIKDFGNAAKAWMLPESCLRSLEQSAAAFSGYKDLRNAVVHSRIYSAQKAIGNRISLKGEIFEVRLTVDALEWLYKQLVNLRWELRCALAIFDLVRTTRVAELNGWVKQGQIDPIPEVMEWLDRLNQCQQERQKLGVAPTFPSD